MKPPKPIRPEPPQDKSRASSEIVLRVNSKRKAAYVRASQRRETDPRTLAAWCFEHLDRASGYEEEAT